jgi:hypothetical protein
VRTAAAALFVLLLPGSIARAQTPPANPSNQTAANPETGSQQTPLPQTVPTANPQRPSQNAPVATVTAGTEIKATLDTPLSSKTSQIGDRFTATIQQLVPAMKGGTAIPSGAHLNGEVSQAQAGRNLPQLRGKGQLNLRFREIVLPNGASIPLSATMVSIRDTRETSAGVPNQEGQVQSTTSGKQVAKDASIGAGIGTIAGLVFGSALKGLAIGAASGGGYVLSTQGKDVNLPANSGLELRLDQPLTIPSSAKAGK